MLDTDRQNLKEGQQPHQSRGFPYSTGRGMEIYCYIFTRPGRLELFKTVVAAGFRIRVHFMRIRIRA